ncbi:MAG: hypothetical protein WEK74_16195 [Hydrogenophaga sp.]
MFGEGDGSGSRRQGVTVPSGHGKPTLGIETERGIAQKHRVQPLKNTFHHLTALFSTLSGKQVVKRVGYSFFQWNQALSAGIASSNFTESTAKAMTYSPL